MKKEFYRHALPHFQQPGQAYFITWSIKDAVPKKALKRYSDNLLQLQVQIKNYVRLHAAGVKGAVDSEPLIHIESQMRGSESAPPATPPELEYLKKQYYSIRKKYMKAFDDLLAQDKNPKINLSKPEITKTLKETLLYWNHKKLDIYAFCIMPNHVHWVFCLFKKDDNNKPVYLQDIMNSVKRFSANQINYLENRNGALWQAENFDTTIRDEKHLYYAIEYSLNNPVKAGLIKNREEWAGNWRA